MILLSLIVLYIIVTGISMTEVLVMGFLGFAGTFITQLVKKYFGLDANAAYGATLAICLGLALLAAWLTGELVSGGIVTGLGIVFLVATSAYRWLLSRDRVVDVLPASVTD